MRNIGRLFLIDGRFVNAARCGNGHINDTFLAAYEHEAEVRRFIHQRINSRIFPDIPGLMQNISRVTRHIAQRSGRSLTLIPARNGLDYAVDEAGAVWRTYVFIEGAKTVEIPQSPDQAFEAACAFGQFAAMLVDLGGPALNETIPHFHDTSRRFSALLDAVSADAAGRAAAVKDDIRFALQCEELAGAWAALRERHVPERVVHNDTKMNNVLLADNGEHCVIDLDTVMPGLSLYDFGDMVRTGAASAREDETDLSKMHVRPEYYRAIARGFSEGCGGMLSSIEREYFLTAAKAITFENGIRFLTDYLQGDIYFRVHRPAHNLDRARSQFALVRSMMESETQLA